MLDSLAAPEVLRLCRRTPKSMLQKHQNLVFYEVLINKTKKNSKGLTNYEKSRPVRPQGSNMELKVVAFCIPSMFLR